MSKVGDIDVKGGGIDAGEKKRVAGKVRDIMKHWGGIESAHGPPVSLCSKCHRWLPAADLELVAGVAVCRGCLKG